MNFDSFSGSNTCAVLEDMFVKCNNELFSNILNLPTINIGVIHGMKHGRFSPQVYSSFGYQSDEITIDGDIIDANNMAVIMMWMLHCMVMQYAFINEIKVTSRKGYYYNRQYKNIAEDHGLLIKKSDIYGYYPYGISDIAINILHKNRWIIHSNREAYTYKDNPDVHGHSIKYVCPQCGDSFRATKRVYMKCERCNKSMEVLM